MNKIFNFFKKQKIVTRIAPSPTGVMHIGTARTALFNYLFARQNGGKFLLRIEDTDRDRSKKEYEEDILNSLKWLGLEHDEFSRQSERTDIYKKYLNKLISDNKAYVSKEENETEEPGRRTNVIRFRNPNVKIKFKDLIRGEIEFDTTELGDFIIAKSLEEPLYHLAVVIDDHEMNVTHILRGEDGISNTPRQILIQRVIGAKTPIYAHLPLILGSDRSKLSKRHGATSLSEFKKNGYLKEAIINYLALLGWNPGNDNEFFTLEELIKEFDISKISKGGAIFNIEKLDWFNKRYLSNISDDYIKSEIEKNLPKDNLNINIKKIIPLIKERIEKLSDIQKIIIDGEIDFVFKKDLNYDPLKLIWKKSTKEETVKNLEACLGFFESNPEVQSALEAKELIWNYAEKEGRGNVLWPLRYALSGKDKSPDPFVLSDIFGKENTINRIKSAINKLNDVN